MSAHKTNLNKEKYACTWTPSKNAKKPSWVHNLYLVNLKHYKPDCQLYSVELKTVWPSKIGRIMLKEKACTGKHLQLHLKTPLCLHKDGELKKKQDFIFKPLLDICCHLVPIASIIKNKGDDIWMNGSKNKRFFWSEDREAADRCITEYGTCPLHMYVPINNMGVKPTSKAFKIPPGCCYVIFNDINHQWQISL